MISYMLIRVLTGKAREVSLLTYAICVLFLFKFFLLI